jgi:hypothetical protein
MPKRKTKQLGSKEKIESIEKRTQAMKLRLGGATYREIGAVLGISMQRAHQIVTGEVQKSVDELGETRDEARQLEVDRLDALLMGVWTKAQRGNLQAVDRVLRIGDRRARLLGLDDQVALGELKFDFRQLVREAAEAKDMDCEDAADTEG